MNKIKISPSILSANFANLGEEIIRIGEAGADFIHVDVMDGSFVPNITIGQSVLSALKPFANIPFDVHLMINNPEKHIDSFIKAGADIITFHIESTANPKKLIEYIKSQNIRCGISIKPSSSENIIYDLLEFIDLVLIMTVEPGFGGQEFMKNQLDKVSKIRDKAGALNKDLLISVDGGINDITANLAIKSGANMLVSGSWLFSQENMLNAINKLRS